MNYTIFLWELLGVVFISAVGTLLHFTYNWSNQYKPLALISAVNESTWEHLKIAFWPALLYSVFEYIPLSSLVNNFIIAKASCLLIIPISITLMFYGYISISGYNILFADICIFILSIYVGQIVSYKLLTMIQLPDIITSLSMLVIILLIILFSLFTFLPPKCFIFKDPIHGGYGIYRKRLHR